MMSSRHPITSEIVQILLLISSCALPSQQPVPCVSPEIWSRSVKFFGCASMSTPRMKRVPISGKPKVAVLLSICSGVTPIGSVEVKL